MGTYYKLVNYDKREVVNPWDAGGCGKLAEWCLGHHAGIIPYLLESDMRWKGCKVAMVGDNNEKEYEKISKWPDITKEIVDELGDWINWDGRKNVKPKPAAEKVKYEVYARYNDVDKGWSYQVCAVNEMGDVWNQWVWFHLGEGLKFKKSEELLPWRLVGLREDARKIGQSCHSNARECAGTIIRAIKRHRARRGA